MNGSRSRERRRRREFEGQMKELDGRRCIDGEFVELLLEIFQFRLVQLVLFRECIDGAIFLSFRELREWLESIRVCSFDERREKALVLSGVGIEDRRTEGSGIKEGASEESHLSNVSVPFVEARREFEL